MLKLYYENDHIRLLYDEELQLGKSEWKGFAGSDDFRSIVLRSLACINDHQLTRWLSDRRRMRAIRQQDQDWVVEAFIPQLLESPLRRMASVVSEDIFNQMAMEQMLKRSGNLGSLTLREFNSEAEAMNWLSQPFANEEASQPNASKAE